MSLDPIYGTHTYSDVLSAFRIVQHVIKNEEQKTFTAMELAMADSDLADAQAHLARVKQLQQVSRTLEETKPDASPPNNDDGPDRPLKRRRLDSPSATPQTRRDSVQASFGPVGRMIAESHPTVVRGPDGAFVEIRCPKCGANTSSYNHTLFSGMQGMISHIKRAHPSNNKILTAEAALEPCTHKRLSAEQSHAILSGDLKAYTVPKVYGSLGVAPARSERRSTLGAASADDEAGDWTLSHVGSRDVVVSAVEFGTPIAPSHPTVVKDPDNPDSYVEMRCYICHANWTHNGHKLFNIPAGLVVHLARSHNISRSTNPHTDMNVVLRRCIYRRLTKAQAEGVLAGDATAYKVEKNGIGSTGPTTSSRSDNSLTNIVTPDDSGILSEDYRTIVRHLTDPDTWVELRCHLCSPNYNYSSTKQKFIKGYIGMKHHLARTHGIDTQDIASINGALARCAYKTLSKEQVYSIRAGHQMYIVPRIGRQTSVARVSGRTSSGSSRHKEIVSTPAPAPDTIAVGVMPAEMAAAKTNKATRSATVKAANDIKKEPDLQEDGSGWDNQSEDEDGKDSEAMLRQFTRSSMQSVRSVGHVR